MGAHQRAQGTAERRRGQVDAAQPNVRRTEELTKQYAAADDELDGGRLEPPRSTPSSAKMERGVSSFHSREEPARRTITATAPSPQTSGHYTAVWVQ